MESNRTPIDLARDDLLRDAAYNFAASLPPPFPNTPENRKRRDKAALAQFLLLRVTTEHEAMFATNYILCTAHAASSMKDAARIAWDPALSARIQRMGVNAVAALCAAEADIMTHCNADHPDAMAGIAQAPGAWRMVAVDVDGCDLAQDERVMRVAWSAPVDDAGAVRRELVRLARAARG